MSLGQLDYSYDTPHCWLMVQTDAAHSLLVLQGVCEMVKVSGMGPLGPEGNQCASGEKCQCKGGVEVAPTQLGCWSM